MTDNFLIGFSVVLVLFAVLLILRARNKTTEDITDVTPPIKKRGSGGNQPPKRQP